MTPETSYNKQRSARDRAADVAFALAAQGLGLLIPLAAIAIAIELWMQANPAIQKFGWTFLLSSDWNPVLDRYGAWPFIIGTVETSLIAMLIAAPLGLGAALFLSEDIIPAQVRTICRNLLELLAAIPSVVYGLWGIFVLIPLLVPACTWLHAHLSWCPLFSTMPQGPGVFPAACVLALMILPTIASLSIVALLAVPRSIREGAYAVGSHRWEAMFRVIVPSAKAGIKSALLLALGRAVGETMAVAMLIGNAGNLTWSIFSPGNTIAAQLANQFGEASGLQMASLMYSALILLVSSFAINSLAMMRVRSSVRGAV